MGHGADPRSKTLTAPTTPRRERRHARLDCEPGWTGRGTRRRNAVVDAARYADALLWRRDRHALGRYCARSGARSLGEERPRNRRRPRRLPDADAMERGALCRLLGVDAVAAAG